MRFFQVWPLFAAVCIAADYTLIDCFASLPSGFSLDDTYEYQASAYCYNNCVAQNANYFALFNHSSCYCGNTNPNGVVSTSDSCTAYCFGYDSEMCGGTSAYSLYAIGDADTGSQSSSASGARSSSSSSSDASSSTASSSDSGSSASSSSSTYLSSSVSSSETTSSTPSSSTTAAASSTAEPTTTTVPSSSPGDDHVVISTSVQTMGGSTVYVTQSITQSASSASETSSTKKSSKPKNLGAIIGGVVGGVCGAAAVAVGILLVIRHINIKREQERMEKEYQEAIKPVDFDDTLYQSSVSSRKGGINPFDDTRRISNGSLEQDTVVPSPHNHNVLTVVNPDE